MPLRRSQLLKLMVDNKKELEEAETVLAEKGTEAEIEAEVVRFLAVLRKNVERIERMLNKPKER